MNNTYFYQDKPLFGLDIGYSSLKVMQIEQTPKGPKVVGYGVARFDPAAVKDGVIVDPESIAKSTKDLFEHGIVGEITTRRVALAIPVARTFNRAITLPKLDVKDLNEAVRLEAEQYIPVPLADLYLDHAQIRKTDKEMDVFAVAAPKKIVDSYMIFSRLLGLEVVAIETTIGAASRLFVEADRSDVPTILIDFGSVSTDITIFDKTVIVTGTVQGGGDNFTDGIAQKLGVTKQEAEVIKTKYGLKRSKKQAEITEVLKPILEQLLKETRRMMRYYEERYGANRKIGQIVSMGGGANMPGLSEYMTDALRMPVRLSAPWQHVGFSKLQPPTDVEKSMYITVCGLAMMHSKEIFV